MMRKLYTCLIICIALMVLFSCASAPKPVPEEPPVTASPAPEPPKPEPVVEEPAPVEPVKEPVPAPETQLARAKELRELIAAYNLSKFAPEKFSAGEEQFRLGRERYNVDNEASGTALTLAAGLYQEVIDTGADAVLSGLQSEADASRTAAAGAGAENLFPRQFALAISRYDAALTHWKDRKLAEAGALLSGAKELFDSLSLKVEIVELNQVLSAYELEQYVSTEAAEARMMYLAGEDLFEHDPAAARRSYQEARDAGRSAVEKAAILVTGSVQGSADGSRALADSVKASVAVKNEYAAAVSEYTRGVQALKAARYIEAYDYLSSAVRQFTAAYRLALEKRGRAEAALDQGKQGIQKLETLAREAEAELQSAGVNPAEVAE